MWKDSIIEEIRKHRDEYSKRFNDDLHLICKDIRGKQGYNDRRVVAPMPRPAKNVAIEKMTKISQHSKNKR
jgi:hypothetical protein